MNLPSSVGVLLAGHILLLAGCVPGSATRTDAGTITDRFSPAEFAAACEAWDDWDKPAPPFRLFGDTYYVGTCGISAILITSPDGHLVIDSGTRRGGELVANSIEALGFSLRDVRYLSHTQEHGDHIGGTADLKRRTGAQMVASPRAQSVFETGVINLDDPQYIRHEPMDTVAVEKLIADGEALVLGNTQVVAHFTPGHSPGAISWRWEECDGDQCYSIVYTDGMGPFSEDGYRWTDHPEYLADYRASVSWLETVDADICLAAHPSQMRLIKRIEAGKLVDPGECSRNGAFTQGRIDVIIEKERAEVEVEKGLVAATFDSIFVAFNTRDKGIAERILADDCRWTERSNVGPCIRMNNWIQALIDSDNRIVIDSTEVDGVSISGHVAWIITSNNQTWVTDGVTSPTKRWGHSGVLVKQGGRWRVAQYHGHDTTL